MNRGDCAFANRLLSNTLQEKVYINKPLVPFPIVDLNITMGTEGILFHYSRELVLREEKYEYI